MTESNPQGTWNLEKLALQKRRLACTVEVPSLEDCDQGDNPDKTIEDFAEPRSVLLSEGNVNEYR